MMFDREKMLQVLDVARLAIDQREFIPILAHFCFQDNKYNALPEFHR